MNIIRAIYCDNEGCILPGKGLPFPLIELQQLQSFIEKHNLIEFGICTGRSVPYVEAMVQVLDLLDSKFPCICEGGALLYWPIRDRWELVTDLSINLNSVNSIHDSLTNYHYHVEPGKLICQSFYPDSPTTVDELYKASMKSIDLNLYNISMSVAAVDITPKGINKYFAVKEVCRRLGVSLKELLYIGDAQNDLEILQSAGYSGCPQNSSDEVKSVVTYVAKANSTQGVLEILNHFESLFKEYRN